MPRFLLVPLSLVIALLWASGAQAAVSRSRVTAPVDAAFLRYDANAGSHISVAGTSDGTAGDAVDLYCTRGAAGTFNADLIVAVDGSGAFSYTGPAGNRRELPELRPRAR